LAEAGEKRAPAELARLFGAERFATPPEALAARLARCRAVVLDWDGVAGPGFKGPSAPASFNEIDAMGLNLLRYALWRRGGATRIPPVVVISGQRDPAALALAERDRLDALYMGFLDKRLALEHLCAARGLAPEEVMFVFDDVIDLGVAERCGARFLVARPAMPLVEAFARERGLCDYVVRAPAGAGAAREACEVALALLQVHEEVFVARGWFDAGYRSYLEARRSVPPVSRWVAERDAQSGQDVVRAASEAGASPSR
jgi:3-deoxy-D-manno-octulosonate 8-phosphate phosphatase (KDO 8-P phosphatase)